MAQEGKDLCFECMGAGVVSNCCLAEIKSTKEHQLQCTNCGKFCSETTCYVCEGEGYMPIKGE